MLIQMLFRFLQVRNLNVELMQLVLQIAVQIRAGEMESLLIAQIKKNTWVYQKKRDLLLQQVNTAITNFWVSVLSIEKPTVFFDAQHRYPKICYGSIHLLQQQVPLLLIDPGV